MFLTRILRSLAARIIALHICVILLAGLAWVAAAHRVAEASFRHSEDRVLGDRAQVIANFVRKSPQGLQLFLPGELADQYRSREGGFAFTVLDLSGHAILGAPEPDTLPGGVWQAGTVFNHNASDRFWSVERTGQVAARPFRVLLVQDLAHPDVDADDVARGLIAQGNRVAFPIVAIILLADVAIVWLAFRPVRLVARTVSSYRPGRELPVILPRSYPSEIEPFVLAVESAFARLAATLDSYREFGADLAHELRTPLAVLRLQVESIGDEAAKTALTFDIDAMSRTIEQMLVLSEIESRHLDCIGTCNLSQVARNVAAQMAPAVLARSQVIEVVGAETPHLVVGHGDSLERAVRNLVENSLRYNAPGGKISIVVETPASISVQDEGPGFEHDELENAFRRHWRRDRLGAGFGLGLAIVSSTLAACGGSAEFRNAPNGGAIVTLRLKPCTI